MDSNNSFDVLILGAGPAGTCAASLLKKKGLSVAIVEREQFPRFSIGESLLPQSMVYLEQAGLLEAVEAAGFQKKDGAAFLYKGQFSVFEFADKFTAGPSVTFQVQRAKFDKVLADTVERNGVRIFYQHNVDQVAFDSESVKIETTDLIHKTKKMFTGKFVLDASGFGRVLPRILKLDRPSNFPSRRAVFGHVKVNRFPSQFDTSKILITVDETDQDVWLWTIPFSDQACSVGVVGTEEYFKKFANQSNQEILESTIKNSPKLAEILAGAEFTTEVRTIVGYASDVSSLYGERFALLGNAGEFLDPIFSSGVTIALHSAILSSELVAKELRGEKPDWENQFSEPLKAGVQTFKTFVTTWYTGELQKIIFHQNPDPQIKKMICSILAGYAWDRSNPYAANSRRAVNALAQICGTSRANVSI